MRYLVLLLALLSIVYAGNFTLTSEELDGQLNIKQEYNGFGCSGENVSPSLTWRDAPKGTKSFALTMYDPDAPTGSGWWHWLVFNLPKSTTSIVSNASALKSLPKGSIESITDYGTSGFGGACPPQGGGDHSYIITVYALDVEKLDLDKNANPALVGYMIHSHTIQKSSLVSYYSR